MHPASRRAASEFFRALQAPLDIGLVYPPRPGEIRGRGRWYGENIRDLSELLKLLDRAAAANCAGAAVFIRLHALGREDNNSLHVGVVLVDDLSRAAISAMERDGLPGCAVVETSPANFQVWVRLANESEITRSCATSAARYLAATYGGDPKAVGAHQPGRLPGFTNRKPQYETSGRYPFVRLRSSMPGLIGAGARRVLEAIREDERPALAQPARVGAPGNEPAVSNHAFDVLDHVRATEAVRIAGEVSAGTRPFNAGSASEVDFATVANAIQMGVSEVVLEQWLRARRPDHHASYAARTIANAARYLNGKQGYGALRVGP